MPRHKLLLADDSATIQKVVNLTFADEGIDVIAVGDGDAAWRRIEAERPDIVLADVHMPGLGGYELCGRIRAHEPTKDLPVMLLVGSFEPFDAAEAERVGASAHLTKPFQSIKQLISRVKELIAPQNDPISFEETIPIEMHAEKNAGSAEVSDGEAGPLEILEVEAASKGLDISDIDSLYNESLEKTVEMPRGFDNSDGFGDVGADDDLIETLTSTADFEETVPGLADERTEPLSEPEDGVQGPELTHRNGQAPSISTNETPEAPPENAPLATNVSAFGGSDLLDIPGVLTASPARAASAPVAQSPSPVVNISPELLELIVQKVIEKLEEKREPSPDSAFS